MLSGLILIPVMCYESGSGTSQVWSTTIVKGNGHWNVAVYSSDYLMNIILDFYELSI